MLVTSNFSFSHNVSLPSQKEFLLLSYIFFCRLQNGFDSDNSKILSCGKELYSSLLSNLRSLFFFDMKQNGADVNVVDNWGVTPMYLAASNGQVDVINYLLSAGAKLSFRNMVGFFYFLNREKPVFVTLC